MYAPDAELKPRDATIGVTTIDFDLGFRAAHLGLGYAFGNGWRAELEGAFRRNEMEILFGGNNSPVNTALEDDARTRSLLASLYYDFDLNLPVVPYLGAGFGIARTDYQVRDARAGEDLLDDDVTAPAGQFVAGFGLWLRPRLQLTVDYRYVRSARRSVQPIDPTATDYRIDHRLHLAALSLRYGARGDSSLYQSSRTSKASTDTGRWYSALRLGALMGEDSDIDDGLIDTNFDAFDIGLATSFVIGREFGRSNRPAWRAELEALRFQNDADVVDFGEVVGEFPLQGPVRTYALMANVVREFGAARYAGLRPYFGLGVGFADVDYQVDRRVAGTTSTGFLRDSDRAFAGQALLGVRVRLSPRFDATLDYRYWWAPSLRLQGSNGIDWDTEHSAHSIGIGLRWRLPH